MDIGQWIVIGLSVIMGAWYVVGATINRRRGIATYHWLREGLESLGEISEARWIGSSGTGARLVVAKARKPFRRVEVVFLLESREILPLWLFNRVRRKQDEMILKATLRAVPPQSYEAARAGGNTLQVFLNAEEGRNFNQIDGLPGFELARRGGEQLDVEARLRAFLISLANAVLRLTIQRQVPHLVLRAQLPHLRVKSGQEVFGAVKSIFLVEPEISDS